MVNYLVMENAPKGDLFDYISTTGAFSEPLARYYTIQLLEGLNHIYQNGLVHRDLKLENIMIDDKFDLKIIDFGTLASRDGHPNMGGMLKTYCGTRSYMAPELLRKQNYDGEKVDMFAVGTLLFMMVVGLAPFEQARSNDLRYKYIKNKQYSQYWAFYQKSTKRQFSN